MLSTGNQSGLEATITRPDGTRFKEYDVKHSINEAGQAVTECWLECEDDAVFQIEVRRHVAAIRRYTHSSWQVVAHVDGRRLAGSIWADPQETKVFQHITHALNAQQYRQGDLTFAPADTTSEHQLSTVDPAIIRELGTITLTLQPGIWVEAGVSTSSPKCTDRIGKVHESFAKLGRVTKSTNERIIQNAVLYRSIFEPDRPDVWQNFVFKYRHRVALQSMGVIKFSAFPRPSPSTSQKRTRTKDVSDTEPQNSSQPVAGPSVRRSSRTQQVPVEDSDSDEETPEEKAARLWEIKMHKEAIERLEKAGKSKGKKRAKIE